LVDVEARSWPGRVVTVLSDDAVDGAEAETLLTTEETMDRSTVRVSATAVMQTIKTRGRVTLTLLLQRV
jgi:hypothetical protein